MWVMARSGYRLGQHQVQVWVSLALRGQMRRAAAEAELSLQEWMVEAFREKLMRDAEPVVVRGPVVDSLKDFIPVGWSWGGEFREVKAEPFEESA